MAPSAALKTGPVTRVCHVCGRQYGLSSFDIHLKQCKKLWLAQEELKPKGERRALPKTPPSLAQMSESETALSAGTVDREAIDAMNRAAQESFNVHGMEKCDNCGRTFAEGRLAIHSKSCRPDSTAKRVGQGAAPRVKAGDADTESGRFRVNMSGSSSSDAPPPAKKSQPRPATESASPEASGVTRPGSSSSSRALSGSIASNRKRVPAQEPPSPSGNRPAPSRLTTPLTAGVSESVTADGLREELKGQASMVDAIQSKLEQWEAATLTTLQEIRDLKQIFSDLKQ
ncbi:hypothetical protein PybrP1_003176 [[Pythium] brassicae (nom. inval.)]|nr:hypothetical protein PybrP1_003176 [[Pythium] brassicae (nom. inval.)]